MKPSPSRSPSSIGSAGAGASTSRPSRHTLPSPSRASAISASAGRSPVPSEPELARERRDPVVERGDQPVEQGGGHAGAPRPELVGADDHAGPDQLRLERPAGADRVAAQQVPLKALPVGVPDRSGRAARRPRSWRRTAARPRASSAAIASRAAGCAPGPRAASSTRRDRRARPRRPSRGRSVAPSRTIGYRPSLHSPARLLASPSVAASQTAAGSAPHGAAGARAVARCSCSARSRRCSSARRSPPRCSHSIGPGGAVCCASCSGRSSWCRCGGRGGAATRAANCSLACLFGLVLAAMNFSFYSAIHRIPLGIAVTFEFVGPLTIALVGSRRPLDLLWVALAAAGILALTRGGVAAPRRRSASRWRCWPAASGPPTSCVNARVGRAFEGGTGLSLAMCVATVVMLPLGVAQGGSHLLEPRSLAARRRRRAAVLGHPLLVRERGAAADRSVGVRRADEHRAGDGRAGRVHRAGAGPGQARTCSGWALVVVASVGAARRTREAPCL